MVWGVEIIIPLLPLVHNSHWEGYPWGNWFLMLPKSASVCWEGREEVRGTELRGCAGTVNPIAELWRGLRWFYLEATASIKLVIAPCGPRSRPVLKWLQNLLYLNMYSTHSCSGSSATSKPGQWLIKGSVNSKGKKNVAHAWLVDEASCPMLF